MRQRPKPVKSKAKVPVAPQVAKGRRSIPDTRVTVHSGDIGNTFGPNGLSIGSSRHVSSSK
jgi:hypothetical protein